MKKRDALDILIPISISFPDSDAVTVADSIKKIYELYGFTRFAMNMPGKGWRRTAYPPRSLFEEKAQLFLDIKKLLPPEISCGWWDTLMLKSGPTPGYTRILRLDGTEAPFSTCPLDPAYRKRFAEDVAFFLAETHPDFYLTEDDFGINCHGGRGCFCKYHLEEFARRTGRNWTREELQDLYLNKAAESREILRQFGELARDSLVLFAKAIREEADKLTPEIPMGICQPGCSDTDGNAAEAVARAIAGRNHTPFIRFHGTFYCGEKIAEIPQVLFNPIYAKEHIQKEMLFYHESDTYPHNRFYTSGGCMRAMMGAVYSCGYDGSIFQILSLNTPNEERAYGKMFREERTRFHVLHKTVEGCHLKGVRLLRDPFEATHFHGMHPYWCGAVSAFGIPYTTREAPITFISGEQMRFMSNEEIKDFLSQTVILDGWAAKVLMERGFEGFMGAKVSTPLLQGNDKFDLNAREVIRKPFLPDGVGERMPRADIFCPRGNGELYHLEITDPACKEVTSIFNSDLEYMAPGMSFFHNSMGGNVIIYAAAMENNFSSSFYNYRRQALFRQLLINCGADFPMIKGEPHVFLLANIPEKEKEKDFAALLTIVNLAVDDLDELSLFLPDPLKNCRSFAALDRNGKWQEMDLEKTSDGIRVKHPFRYTDPVFVKIQ